MMRSVLFALLLGWPALLAAQEDDGEAVETIQEEKQHQVVQANTLWDLAQYFYKDPWKWPVIYDANKDRIKDPHWIYPGQVFIIPGFGTATTIRKTKAPVEAAAPVSEPEPEPMEEAPETPPPAFRSDQGQGVALPEALSDDFPKGMTAQGPSAVRMKMPSDWVPDGKVMEYQGRESMAAAGDKIRIRVSSGKPIRKRDRFDVYRWGGPTEADLDKKGKYTVKVAIIEVVKKLSGRDYLAVILSCGDSVQLNDVIRAEQ
ncbi:MAG: hypothetical protein A2X36_08445 [Elusimicrobia bacterium GWA2_69_24]|nr:MAG: hypothetical protein A2X36_08445 [Elusimicrobia bacterium GWA2_69_24]